MKITVAETVWCWGRESSTFDIDVSLDELKTRVAKYFDLDADEEVTPSDIGAYLTDEYDAESYDLDIKEIKERTDATVEVHP